MLKVVVDTNIFVSSLLSKKGLPAEIIKKVSHLNRNQD